MSAAHVATQRRSLRVLSVVLGACFGLVCVLVFWLLSLRNPLPPLSAEDFHAAQQRWRENGPAHYDIEVQVSGRQPAVFLVKVRHGEPIAAYRNGQQLPQRRTWETWTVPGMFGTLESDFRHVAMVEKGTSGPSTPRLALSGEFHPHYGYPQVYRRLTLGEGSEESMAHRIRDNASLITANSSEVAWRVTKFTLRAPEDE